MPLPSAVKLAVGGRGVRNEATKVISRPVQGNDVFVKPLGIRNKDGAGSQRTKLDKQRDARLEKLSNAYGSASAHPRAKKASISKARARSAAPAPPRSKSPVDIQQAIKIAAPPSVKVAAPVKRSSVPAAAMYAKPKAAAVASKAMAPIPKGKKADKVHAPLTYTNVFESKQVEPAASIGVFSNFNVTMMKSYAEAASPRKKAAPSRSVLTATTAFAPSAPVDDQHDTMMQIFSNRLLKIKAAKIEAKGGSNSAIQFLAKHGDTALAMDMLPIINKNVAISESEAYTGQKPSLSACLELLPVLKEMVESRYETYQITALQSILAILTCWEKDFKAGSTAVSNKGGRQGTVSSQGFTLGCLTMYKTIQTLTDGGSIEKCTVSRKVIGLLDTF